MKTSTTHELKADSISVDHTWKDELILTVTDGNDTVRVSLDPAQVKKLMKHSRNSLIEAKIIRGKKQY